MAELRPKVFREPELLEAVSEVLTGRGGKTAIQSSGGREQPCVAQSAACAILGSALKVGVPYFDCSPVFFWGGEGAQLGRSIRFLSIFGGGGAVLVRQASSTHTIDASIYISFSDTQRCKSRYLYSACVPTYKKKSSFLSFPCPVLPPSSCALRGDIPARTEHEPQSVSVLCHEVHS